MQILENVFLKKKLQQIQLKYSFLRLKSLNYHQNTHFNTHEVYLKYMEGVLLKKEEQLIELENELNQRNAYLRKKQLEEVLIKPNNQCASIEQIQLLLENLREQFVIPLIKSNHNHNAKLTFEAFQKKQQQIMKQCKWKKQLSDSLLRDQYEQINKLKKLLNQKISHFQSLQSYQAYLLQLEQVLQNKFKTVESNNHSVRVENYSHQVNIPDQSISQQNPHRRRTKIFQNKSDVRPQCQHTFGQSESTIRQESTIKVENQEYQSDTHNQSSQLSNIYMKPSQKQKTIKQIKIQKSSIGTQINQQSASQTWKRLKEERLKIKFLNIWFKYSGDSKGSIQHKKCMFLFRWRINACFYQDACAKINGHLALMDKQWLSRSIVLKSQKLFPYNELSNKRKKYLQLFLDYQKRLLFHKTQFLLLSSICRNKNRKQRLVFLLYFKKWSRNSIIESNKNNKQQTTPTSIFNRSSQIGISGSLFKTSSQIMSEQRIQKSLKAQKKKSSTKIKNLSQCSQSHFIGKSTSQKIIKGKQNQILGQTTISQVDLNKLKLYIKEKEQVQKILAIQYLRIQASSKIGLLLKQKILTPYHLFITNIKLRQSQIQTNKIQSQLQDQKFKWQLFMTKCRLALVNSSNKIYHLQQILGHSLIDK